MSLPRPRPLYVTMALVTIGALLVESAPARQPPNAGASRSAATEPFSLDLCCDAWRRREHSTKYLRFGWTQTETISKGMFPVPARLRLEGKKNAGARMPRTDTTLAGTFGVLFSGGDIRYEEDADVFSAERNESYRAHDIRIFANDRYLARSDAQGGFHAIGEIQPPARNMGVVRERNIVPLALFFRILDPQYGQFAADKIEVDPNPVVIDGHRCRLLRRSPSKALKVDLCVDVERDYIPLRCTFYEDGHVTTQQTITKVWSRAGGVFAPGEWTMSRFRSDGKLISELRGSATSCLVPTKMSNSEFELQFPAGTWVFDNIAHRQYVVQKTGFERVVPPGYGDAQYEWLMNPANNERSPSSK
ncbi:MAG TPA: hypothetical protein VFG04_00310 [Planctomycetaceae bacterium]|jgi:hypothetical protein|nr:hypothetical protein [Planctomycetaceae bacterium]